LSTKLQNVWRKISLIYNEHMEIKLGSFHEYKWFTQYSLFLCILTTRVPGATVRRLFVFVAQQKQQDINNNNKTSNTTKTTATAELQQKNNNKTTTAKTT
jgi:hypothetical protein